MSILNPETLIKDTDIAVREDILMKTREGQVNLLKIELAELLEKFNGEVVCEITKERLMRELSVFGEHVNCRFGMGCKCFAEYEPRHSRIRGFFDYRPHYTIDFTRIEFVLQ